MIVVSGAFAKQGIDVEGGILGIHLSKPGSPVGIKGGFTYTERDYGQGQHILDPIVHGDFVCN